MPVDPAVAGVLALRAQRNLPGYAEITVEQIRAGTDMIASPAEAAAGRSRSHRRGIRAASPSKRCGSTCPPLDPAPYPVIVHYHGGGFVTGKPGRPRRAKPRTGQRRRGDRRRVDLPQGTRVEVPGRARGRHDRLEVGGRARGRARRRPVAPCRHGRQRGGELGGLGGRPRPGRRQGRRLKAMALLYPLVSPAADTPSRRDYAQGYIIDAPAVEYFRTQYARRRRTSSTRALPLDRTPSLAGLPPTLVLTNEYDMFARRGRGVRPPARAGRGRGHRRAVRRAGAHRLLDVRRGAQAGRDARGRGGVPA